MGWIGLWTVRMMTCPTCGRGCASFCPSWPTHADDPGARRAEATGLVSNRNTNWAGMSTIRATSNISTRLRVGFHLTAKPGSPITLRCTAARLKPYAVPGSAPSMWLRTPRTGDQLAQWIELGAIVGEPADCLGRACQHRCRLDRRAVGPEVRGADRAGRPDGGGARGGRREALPRDHSHRAICGHRATGSTRCAGGALVHHTCYS